jgi:hypothetical protein
MAILREATKWTKPRPANATRASSDLTPAEQDATRVAIRFLAKRLGTYRKLAQAMSVKPATLKRAIWRGAVSAGLALRVARVADAPLEDLLAGRWPRAGACPYCGRV